ncbi:MAG: endonuclease/exonuclease/phosphatase family protein [Clostridia bacterium]|nr:endonuclease/exonuclease/phosphatase family protein [Clostridia bacterium]
MKKNKKLVLASILAAGFAFGGAMALNANVASADSAFTGVDFTNVVMSKGAAVRVSADVNDTNYGIRFQMNMDQTTYTALEGKGASYGIAIFPADYNYAISESAIFAEGSKATLVTSETLSDVNEDGTYDMWGSLTNIKPANVTREFVGIGYVELNGEYKLANAYGGDIANNTRSIYYVAQLAVDNNDPKAEIAQETYIDTFDTTGKEYAYKVNHVYKKDGEVVKTDVATEYGTLNGTATATRRADGYYKYNEVGSTLSGKLYANTKTTLTVVYEDNTVATTYNADYVKETSGTVALDLTKFQAEVGGVEKVYVDGAEVATTKINETQLSVPVVAGAREIAVYDGDKCYVADVKVADYEISDQATLQAWGNVRHTAKYAVVCNDVVCDGSTDLHVWTNPFLGTLDGLGHTVSNAYYSGGLFAEGGIQAGAVMKDVAFKNVKFSHANYGLLGMTVSGGTLENVEISASFATFDWDNGKGSLLCDKITATNGEFVMRNVKLRYTLEDADLDTVARLYDDEGGTYGTIMENVEIISLGKVAKQGEKADGKATASITLGEKSKWTNVQIFDKDDLDVQVDKVKNDTFTDSWTDNNAIKTFQLRVGSYNTAHCMDYPDDKTSSDDGKEGVVDFQAFGNLLKSMGVDIVGLQEMYDDSNDFLYPDYNKQTQKLAEYFGAPYYTWESAKEFDWGGNVDIGNSVISKYNITNVETYAVPAPVVGDSDYQAEYSENYEDRVIVKTTIDIGTEICFITTHFGLVGAEQARMVAKLVEVLDAETRPVILCGDFNNSPTSTYLKPIYDRLQSTADLTGKRNEFTCSSWNPTQTIDYIFVSDHFIVKDYGVVDVLMSDHMPIWADLEIVVH